MPRARLIFLCLLLPAVLIIFIYSFLVAYYNNSSLPIASLPNYLHLTPVLLAKAVVANRSSTDEPSHERRSPDDELPVDEVDNSMSMSMSSPPAYRFIDVVEEFPNLELNPDNTSFWTSELEDRYQRNETQFPLKVCLVFVDCIVPHQSNCLCLQVILLPHSHNDPGWLNTYDQYFYQYTYYILENAIKSLTNQTDMTFIWAEMSFLSRWLDTHRTNLTKDRLVRLMKESRFEIATGGWVMTDEGPAHYYDMLDQLIEGHQFLRTTFGYERPPPSAWSIDSFGHGATFPYLLRRAGIDRMYIQRSHFAWKAQLARTRSLEFTWRQAFDNLAGRSRAPPARNSILCHMSPLALYSFKYTCGPDPKTCLDFDFRHIFGEESESTATPLNERNIEAKAHQILGQYGRLGSLFEHNVALVPLGDDFRYNFDLEWQQQYDNYKMLINYVNEHPDKFGHAQMSFGTLDDYFSAIEKRQPLVAAESEDASKTDSYPSLVGDFMPYADVYVKPEPQYWTGYYSTRPYFKALGRQTQHWLRVAEILYTLARNHVRQTPHFGSESAVEKKLNQEYKILSEARQNLALFQHHDGITSTSKDYVMEDYAHRLAHSMQAMIVLAGCSLQYLALNKHTVDNVNSTEQFVFVDAFRPVWSEETKRQVFRIPANTETSLKLIIFNSHLQWRREVVSFLVEDPFIKVVDLETGLDVPFQVNPVYQQSSNASISSSVFSIEFVDTFKPLATKIYQVHVLINAENLERKVHIAEFGDTNVVRANSIEHSNNEAFVFEKASEVVLENSKLKIYFDQATGYIENILFKESNTKQSVNMSFGAYHSKPTESGAYLFRPTEETPDRLFEGERPTMHLFRGEISSTLLVNYSDIAFEVKLHNTGGNLDTALSLTVHTNLHNKYRYDDREVVLRLQSDIANVEMLKNGFTYRTFHVDSNGFQMIKRTWLPEVNVSGNYYPMTTGTYIEDGSNRLTLLSSYSHGVTSPEDGLIEVMLDRRIVEDDLRGLRQGVLDNLPVDAHFWLVFEPRPQDEPLPCLTKLADSLLLQLNYPVTLAYAYRGEADIAGDITTAPRPTTASFYQNQQLLPPASLNWMCDEELFLVNLRTLPTAGSFGRASDSSLLILHRRRRQQLSDVPSAVPSVGGGCQPSESSEERVESLLEPSIVQVLSIAQTSLTALETIKDIDNLGQLRTSTPAFELSSFNLTFV